MGWFRPPIEGRVWKHYVPYEKAKKTMSDVTDEFYEAVTISPDFIEAFIESLYLARSVEKDIYEAEDAA